jgi:hypothetical protein
MLRFLLIHNKVGVFITGLSAPPVRRSTSFHFVKSTFLRTKVRFVSFGFLDRPQQDTSIPVNDPRSKTTAVALAWEGIVLLKNDPKILPLYKYATSRIAVMELTHRESLPPLIPRSCIRLFLGGFSVSIVG